MGIIVKCNWCDWEKLAYTPAIASKYAREHATKHKEKTNA